MSSLPLSPQQRAQRWGTVAKWGAFALIGFIVAPFMQAVITGMLGLIVAGAIAGATWVLLPVVESMGANLRIKLIRAEAARNPIETLTEDLRQKTVALDERKTSIETLDGQTRTFADKVDGIKQKYGAQDSGYIKLNSDLVNLRKVLANRQQKWKEAYRALQQYGEEIDRASMIWDASQAAAAARESSGLSEDEFYQKLRSETAFDSVTNSFNSALASLETSMLPDEAEKEATASSATPVQVESAPQGALPPADPANVIEGSFRKVRSATGR